MFDTKLSQFQSLITSLSANSQFFKEKSAIFESEILKSDMHIQKLNQEIAVTQSSVNQVSMLLIV